MTGCPELEEQLRLWQEEAEREGAAREVEHCRELGEVQRGAAQLEAQLDLQTEVLRLEREEVRRQAEDIHRLTRDHVGAPTAEVVAAGKLASACAPERAIEKARACASLWVAETGELMGDGRGGVEAAGGGGVRLGSPPRPETIAIRLHRSLSAPVSPERRLDGRASSPTSSGSKGTASRWTGGKWEAGQ